jgi:hypothetical protein
MDNVKHYVGHRDYKGKLEVALEHDTATDAESQRKRLLDGGYEVTEIIETSGKDEATRKADELFKAGRFKKPINYYGV